MAGSKTKEEQAEAAKSLETETEEFMELDSTNFDPLRALYASSVPYVEENAEAEANFSELLQNELLSPEALLEKASAMVNRELSEETDVENQGGVEGGKLESPKTKDDIQGDLSTGKNCTESDLATTNQPEIDLATSQPESDLTLLTIQPESDLSDAANKRQRNYETRSVLTEMVTGFKEGPLNILKRSVEEKLKVRVWTRNVRAVRGISTGYIVAFDKHMNLAMMDVDEVYRKPCGKHQKKSKKPQDSSASSFLEQTVETPTAEQDTENKTETTNCYPNVPWDTVQSNVVPCETVASGYSPENDLTPADGIGNLPSAFRAMQVFEVNETTRLLGTQSRKALSRHLNQVLIRGEHVVAVALVE